MVGVCSAFLKKFSIDALALMSWHSLPIPGGTVKSTSSKITDSASKEDKDALASFPEHPS
jgi:hypothetical protein